MPVPKFTPRSYYNAAKEHLSLAIRLREQGDHFISHFFAGIAVESILRSLSVKEGDQFDGTHDVEHWAKKSNLFPLDSSQDRFRAKLIKINIRMVT